MLFKLFLHLSINSIFMNDRIQLILKTKNISASKFADEIGVQRSSISHILSGRNNPSLEFIQKILKRFPDINSSWILSGKGSMYDEPDLFSSLEEHKNEKNKAAKDIINSPEEIIEDENSLVVEDQDVTFENNVNPVQNKTVPKERESLKSGDNNMSRQVSDKKTQVLAAKAFGKKIERIIIFYSDKSCIEYNPE